MNVYETKWLEERLGCLERRAESIGLVTRECEIRLSPEVRLLCVLVTLEELSVDLGLFRRALRATTVDRISGETLHGIAAAAHDEWEHEAERYGLPRCERPGWRPEDRCEHTRPDGTTPRHIREVLRPT